MVEQLVDVNAIRGRRASGSTTKRSDLAGWAEYGYCASHSRFFWGLRMHLISTVHGLLIAWALTGAKADVRAVLRDPLTALSAPGRTQHLLAVKNYYGAQFETDLADSDITLIRPARKGEPPRWA